MSESTAPQAVDVKISDRCGVGTQELVLSYADTTVEGARALADQLKVDHPHLKPCDIAARHDADGILKLTFAYQVPGGKRLRFQKSLGNGSFVIDHWMETAAVAKPVKARMPASGKKSPVASVSTTLFDNLNDLSQLSNVELRSYAMRDSPYIDSKVERNAKVPTASLKSRPLAVPLIEFQLGETELNFLAQEFPFKEFQLSHVKMSDALKVSLDAIIEMAKREDWIRASAANDILLSSRLGKEYHTLGFMVPALRGHLKLKSSVGVDGKTDNRLFAGGISIWRETLLRQAVHKKASDPFLDFMYLESLRYLFLEKDYYTGLALIDESKGIQWTPSVIERTDYLQGVALHSLGMRQKAQIAFQEYLGKRKKMNIRDLSDRRLLPSAAFRIADIEFSKGDYAAALIAYEKAMDFLPGSQKENLEGYLYPRSLVAFPQVLFSMAEAHIRLGEYAKALKRLRALITFDVGGTNQGIALYRIGEILEFLGSDPKKVASIFRECAYRYPGYMSGNLCNMRDAVMETQNFDRKFWPRLEASFLKFEISPTQKEKISLSTNDRKTYSALVKSKFYMDRNRPLVAISALDKTRNLESSAYLRNWNYEFSASAFLGGLREEIKMAAPKNVILSYEQRRKTQLLYTERPSIALAVAQAYAEQGLWSEGEKALKRAQELSDVLGPVAVRPFDYTAAETAYIEAWISVGLFDEGKIARVEVEKRLKNLDDEHLPSIFLLIGYSQKSKNLDLEIAAWNRLEERSKLDWTQTRSFSSALINGKRDKELRNLLERRVGAWFFERDKLSESQVKSSSPGSALLLRLAESRIKAGALDSGIRVLEYLLTLDAKELDVSTPKELLFYTAGKAYVSKKDEASARRSFDAATALAPASVWGRLAATEAAAR